MMKKIVCIALAVIMIAACTSCAGSKAGKKKVDDSKKGCLGLTAADDGTILLAGEPIWAFGVNIYDIFVNKRLYNPEFDCEAPFKALHEAGIPVARVSIGPYNVVHLAKYESSEEEYFEALDAVIAAAEKWKIGLFASISWNSTTIPEMVGEHLNAMGKPESKTVAYAKEYYSKVVARYKDSPAIWAWEFGNEYNLNADLGFVTTNLDYLPGKYTLAGEARNWEDYYSSYDIQKYYTAVSEEMRKIDADRLIVGGDSDLSERPASLRNRGVWLADTVEDITESTLLYAPGTMGAVSSHMYQGGLASKNDYRDFNTLLKNALEGAKAAKKGYYIGEYGPGTCWNDKTATEEMYEKCVDLIHEACIKQGVQIALAWNCTTDYDGTAKSLGSELGEYWFDEIVKYNKYYKDRGMQDNIDEYWKNVSKTLDYDAIKNKCSNYFIGTGNPECVIKTVDGSWLAYWINSNYDTGASVDITDDTLADGTAGKVFKMENKSSSDKCMLKNSEIKGLKTDKSYILSFYMKTENMKSGGVSFKMLAPEFYAAKDIKCRNDGEWELFEIEIGSPKAEKSNYSITFTLEGTEGVFEFYGLKLVEK